MDLIKEHYDCNGIKLNIGDKVVLVSIPNDIKEIISILPPDEIEINPILEGCTLMIVDFADSGDIEMESEPLKPMGSDYANSATIFIKGDYVMKL